MKVTIKTRSEKPGETTEEVVECGTYTFERNDQHGPLILTFLKDNDRQSANNEPLRVVTGVLEFVVTEGGQNAAQTK